MLSLKCPENHNFAPLNEEILRLSFHNLPPKSKSKHLQRFLKPGQNVQPCESYPSNIFLEGV